VHSPSHQPGERFPFQKRQILITAKIASFVFFVRVAVHIPLGCELRWQGLYTTPAHCLHQQIPIFMTLQKNLEKMKLTYN
jgi:hypothetical protein